MRTSLEHETDAKSGFTRPSASRSAPDTSVQVGGGAPVVVQSMTMTDTADARATAQQCIELAEAGSEMVRVTVNVPEAAAARPGNQAAHARRRLHGAAHRRLSLQRPPAAHAVSRLRARRSTNTASIPATSAPASARDEQFATICKVAVDHGKPVRIGVNGGSLNQELVVAKMQENTDRNLGRSSEDIINECMVLSAIESTALAIESGLRKDQIIISCKTSRPQRSDRRLSRRWRSRPTSRCISG